MSFSGTKPRTSRPSATSSGRSSKGSTNGVRTKHNGGNNVNGPSTNDDPVYPSISSMAARSPGSKLSSGYLSDVNRNFSSMSFSDWSTDFHKRQRSPNSKIILADIKEKLLDEVKNVELEIGIIEDEKLALLNVRIFVVNFRTLLDESERNNQGLLVGSKLKNIVENTISDIGEYDEAVLNATGIPLSEELRISLYEVRDTVSGLTRPLLKMEHIEEVFCKCGRLFGIVDTILNVFYDQDHDSAFLDEDEETHPVADATYKSSENSQNGSQLRDKFSDHAENDQQGSGLVDIDQSSPQKYGNDDKSYGNAEAKQREEYEAMEQKIFLEEIDKQIRNILSHLKVVERMRSGRPKMKCLVSKFQELDESLKTEGLEKIEHYSLVLEQNIRRVREVLELEKPGQNELDDARFLLSELGGRASILSMLVVSEGDY